MSDLNEDAGSLDASATDTLDDAAISAPSGDESGSAVSSPAAQQDGTSERTVLSVVRDAVREKPAAGDPESSDGNESDHQQKNQAQKGAAGDDEFAGVPFNSHPRFRQLVAERNSYKQNAERYGSLTQFLDENNLSGEDAANAINWAALRKTDPEGLWQEMRPFVQQLLTEIGEVLPPDLRQQVAAGTLPPDAAKLIAKERAKAGIARSQMSFREQQTARQAERQTAQREQERVAAVLGAAQDWERAQRGRDAEFHRYSDELQREVLFLQHRDGRPGTPEGVKAQLDTALRSVKSRFAGRRGGRPPAMQPLTGGSTAGSSQAKPQSVLEAVQRRGSAG